jgi:predicted TIM-barrel fold metal-dependent hydrolase
MISSIPIFDSLTHPTIDGTWISSRSGTGNTLRHLEQEMDTNNVQWGLAVGMKGIGGYDHAKYLDYVRTSSRKLFPVAFCDVQQSQTLDDIRREMEEVRSLGYIAVKLHPRFSQLSLRSDNVQHVVREAAAAGLGVLICTYFYPTRDLPAINTLADVAFLLANAPSAAKILLLHGGDVNLLAMMEYVRAYPNVLLDLSFTLCRYEGSSIDLDIKYLFRSFDRRISVGSDSPQFGLDRLRRRFDTFAQGENYEKCANVAYRNLLTFAGLT